MKHVTLRAELCMIPQLTAEFWDLIDGSKLHQREVNLIADLGRYAQDGDLFVEAAGRLCYESWDLPREATATNDAYMANIKKQLHFSIMEHASFSFYLDGVSRALLAELTRHRHQSFSVRSQRYCDERESDYVIPPVLLSLAAEGDRGAKNAVDQYHALHARARWVYRDIQRVLEAAGEDRKTANDAARYALPEGTETKLFVTGNGRSWTELLVKRDNPKAAEEIHLLAVELTRALKAAAPGIFGAQGQAEVK